MHDIGTVLSDGLNVHDKPGRESETRIIDKLKKGDEINLFASHRGEVGDWRRIEYIRGHERKSGWVMTFNRSTLTRFVDIMSIPDYRPPPYKTQDSRKFPWAWVAGGVFIAAVLAALFLI